MSRGDVIKRTPVTESSTRLEVLGPVVVTEDYTFVSASPVTAFVIPRNAVTAGDYDRFANAAARRVAEAKQSAEGPKA